MIAMTKIEKVDKHGIKARGKREYLAFLRGSKLTFKQCILARCYECCNLYQDGKKDCENKECPLHLYMPYRKEGVIKTRKLSEKTKAKLRERRTDRIEFLALVEALELAPAH